MDHLQRPSRPVWADQQHSRLELLEAMAERSDSHKDARHWINEATRIKANDR